MSKWIKILIVIGFGCALTAHTLHPCLWKNAWFQLIAFAFVCYTRIMYLQSKGNWSLFFFIVWLTALSAFIDEIFFDPTKININEYIATIIIIIITTKYREKWIR